MFVSKSRFLYFVTTFIVLATLPLYPNVDFESSEGDAPSIAAVEFFLLGKGEGFIQESDELPERLDEYDYPFDFSSYIEVRASSENHRATLILPGGSEVEHSTSLFINSLFFHRFFATAEDLHEAYPSGDYTLNIFLEGAEPQSVTLNFPDMEFPSVPHVLNFNELQGFDSRSSITVEWAPFVGGTASDFILFEIGGDQGNAFLSPEPGEPGALDGTSTSIEIPAGVLEEGASYYAALTFTRVVAIDETSIPGATGLAGLFAFTEMEIHTLGASDPEDDLQIVTPSPLPNAIIGEAYSVNLQTDGGIPPFVWTAVEDEILPSGITLNIFDGTLSGTPVEEGVFTFTMRVVDGTFRGGEKTFTLTVLGQDEEPTLETPLLTEIGQSEGVFTFMLSGAGAGMTYTIETSTDLENWAEILTIPSTDTAPVSFKDGNAADFRNRFYRVRID